MGLRRPPVKNNPSRSGAGYDVVAVAMEGAGKGLSVAIVNTTEAFGARPGAYAQPAP